MTKQFQFRLIDTGSPSGELHADRLIELVQNLKSIAMRIGRLATTGEPRGRLRKVTEQTVNLSIGLGVGSTALQWRRAPQYSALEIELPHEAEFDRTFEAVITSLANNKRPSWFDDAFARDVGALRDTLERSARTVEFSSDGTIQTTFHTSDTTRETWVSPTPHLSPEEIQVVGQLRAVNLDTHRLRVTDDVGNKVSLISAVNDLKASPLLGQYGEVTGSPERTPDGQLTQIHNATIAPAEPVIRLPSRGPIDLEELLTSALGPDPGGITGLTDEEADEFLRAIGL